MFTLPTSTLLAMTVADRSAAMSLVPEISAPRVALVAALALARPAARIVVPLSDPASAVAATLPPVLRASPKPRFWAAVSVTSPGALSSPVLAMLLPAP